VSNDTSAAAAALLPCPFCGSPARLSFGDEVVNVRCLRWGRDCLGAGSNEYSEADARKAWNRRTPATGAAGGMGATFAGWAITRCADGAITMTHDDGSVVVVHEEPCGLREIPEAVLWRIADAILSAKAAPGATPAVPTPDVGVPASPSGYPSPSAPTIPDAACKGLSA
jgi:hypothetical protein